jgi:tetratricopeptide (TPR) repeat protein
MRSTKTTLIAAGWLFTCAAAYADWDAGVAAFKGKNFAQATKEFEGVVKERPDWAGGYLMLGRTQLLVNRANEAVLTLRKGYDLDPSDLEIQLALAQAYLSIDRSADASQLLSKLNPASVPKERKPLLLQLQAKAAADSGHTDRAVSALEKAAAANPNDAAIQYNYGVAALNAGQTSVAVGALEKAVRGAPGDLDKQELLVQTLVRQGRESKGPAKDGAYSRCAEVARGLASKAPTTEHQLMLGECQLGAGQYDGAIATFAQVSAKSGGDWLPYFYTGQAQTALAHYPDAEVALKRALEKTGDAANKTRIYRQMGFVYEKQKNFAQAKSAYRSAGDDAGVARIEENEKIAENNKHADEEAAKLEEIKRQQEKLRQQLEQQGGSPPPIR